MNKLQAARQNAGLSQTQLAARAGINLSSLQKYERDAKDINGAKLKTLLKLCQALSCNLADILDDPELLELIKEK